MRRTRRARRLRRGAIGLLLFGVLIAGGLLWLTGSAPLLDPGELFPAEGSLTIVEGPIDAIVGLDRLVETGIADLPALLEFRGLAIDLPPGALKALAGSGPWRLALWRSSDQNEWALFLGGEAYAPARRRWLGSVTDRLARGEWRSRVIEVRGAIVIGPDKAWLDALRTRAAEASTRAIETGGLRLTHEEPTGGSVDLWIESMRAPDGGSVRTKVTERGTLDRDPIPWRDRLGRYGVDFRERPEWRGETPAMEEARGEMRVWEARGVQEALREAWIEFRRFQ